MENVRTIKSLSNEQICYVKRLYLENSFFGGVVCYTRPLSESYKMKIRERSENELYLYQYSEEEYPKDALDEAIFNALEKDYPNIICKTSLQLFDSELEDNLRWKNERNHVVSNIQIEERVNANNTPFASPQTYIQRMLSLNIEIYYLKGIQYDRTKAEALRLYPCSTAEYNTLVQLINNTYSVFSNIK